MNIHCLESSEMYFEFISYENATIYWSLEKSRQQFYYSVRFFIPIRLIITFKS